MDEDEVQRTRVNNHYFGSICTLGEDCPRGRKAQNGQAGTMVISMTAEGLVIPLVLRL